MPAHVRASRELHPRPENHPDQTVVLLLVARIGPTMKLRFPDLLSQIGIPLPITFIGLETRGSQRQRLRKGSLENLGKEVAIGSGCEVKKHPPVPHLL